MTEPTTPFHPTFKKICDRLDAAAVPYKTFTHEPVRTSQEAAALRPEYSIDQGAKALIIRIKRAGEKTFVMLVLPGGARFDSVKAKALLDAKGIRFALPTEVETITSGVEPGGVPPFGDIFGLPVYLDKSLRVHDEIIFNCGDRRVSLAMPRQAYEDLVQPTIGDFVESPASL